MLHPVIILADFWCTTFWEKITNHIFKSNIWLWYMQLWFNHCSRNFEIYTSKMPRNTGIESNWISSQLTIVISNLVKHFLQQRLISYPNSKCLIYSSTLHHYIYPCVKHLHSALMTFISNTYWKIAKFQEEGVVPFEHLK